MKFPFPLGKKSCAVGKILIFTGVTVSPAGKATVVSVQAYSRLGAPQMREGVGISSRFAYNVNDFFTYFFIQRQEPAGQGRTTERRGSSFSPEIRCDLDSCLCRGKHSRHENNQDGVCFNSRFNGDVIYISLCQPAPYAGGSRAFARSPCLPAKSDSEQGRSSGACDRLGKPRDCGGRSGRKIRTIGASNGARSSRSGDYWALADSHQIIAR